MDATEGPAEISTDLEHLITISTQIFQLNRAISSLLPNWAFLVSRLCNIPSGLGSGATSFAYSSSAYHADLSTYFYKTRR